ncbi:MAG: sulfite exporter TauE/SafE family protein [Flavipsychrobacter sp.]
MNTLTLTMALLMGFTGSLHCAGMCGPIIWVMPFQLFKGFKKVLGLLLYHTGRISTYALLAVILHSFRSLFQPQVQQYISIILGVMLLLIGLAYFIPASKVNIALPWTEFVKKQIGKFMGKPAVFPLFITGILNGLLPCGLVYMALSASVTAPTISQAVVTMYAFGIGTLPMLISLTLLKNKARFLHFQLAKKLVPVVMFALGSLFVLRGMNLGIPYLSPKVKATAQGVKASCCHKNKSELKVFSND